MFSYLKRPSMRWARAAWLGLGLGWLAGAAEAIEIAAHLRLDLAWSGAFLLSLTALVFGAVLGAGAGLASGVVIQVVGRGWRDSTAYAASMALTTWLVGTLYLQNAASIMLEQGRPPAAAAMLAFPVGLAGVVWFNAGYWARREEFGAPDRVGGWGFFSLATAVVVAAVAATIGSSPRSGGSGQALAGDPNVLLITIDTLRRDHVSAYGESPAHTPRMDALAEEGLLFWNALTPTPETGPAHASILTSLHPLRHEVISNGHHLARGFRSVAEELQDEGYATGAFLSSFAVNHRLGLDQGFDVYEDDFVPRVRGFTSILGARWAMSALMVLGTPHDYPWLLERGGAETNRLASSWIRARGDRPWFAWVHYFEPHAPYEGPDATVDHRSFLSERDPTYTEAEAAELRRLYAHEAELSDDLVGELLDLLDELELADNTLVVVTSDHGEQLGEHGIWFHHHGLYDESLQVPLIVRAPGIELTTHRVDQQVRLMDIAPTMLEYIKLDPLEPSEGAELLGYGTGVRDRDLACTLFGRKTASLSEGTLFGMRLPAQIGDEGETHDAKYIYDPASAKEELYDLSTDPDEQTDLAADQREAVERCRQLVEREMNAAKDLAADVDADEIKKLQAMGYVE